jgi:hypothetical protein
MESPRALLAERNGGEGRAACGSLPYITNAPCGVTIIQAAAPSLVLTKRWRSDGTCDDYALARSIHLRPVALPDFAALFDLLRVLADRPRCAIVRAAVADPSRVLGVRRLLHPDPDTGEAPTLREVPRRWCALDLDSVPLPEGTDPRDLERCARHVLALLPPAFREARCIVQATAGHAIKPGARLRCWFWLSRPTIGADLAQWLAGFPVDPSCHRAAQAIYTASPLFEGRDDPLPRRLALLPGAEAVAVPPSDLLRSPPPPIRAPRVGAEGDGARALAWAEAEIAKQSEGSRHDTALRVAGWLAALATRGEVPASAIPPTIARALQAAGKDAREGLALAAFVLSREGLA